MAGMIGRTGRSDSNRWRAALWGGIAALLLAPRLAMQLTDETAWTAHDFAVATVLLVGGGLAYEAARRMLDGARQRRLAAAAILFLVLAIWAQGAVGIV